MLLLIGSARRRAAGRIQTSPALAASMDVGMTRMSVVVSVAAWKKVLLAGD
jgi:hypothetical protein